MLRLMLCSCCCFTTGITTAQNFGGNPSSVKWMQVQSPGARVIFPRGLDSQASRISRVISLLDSSTLYSLGTQRKPWNVILQNRNTESNAYVRLAPVMSELYMTPAQDNFAFGSIRWDDNLVIHEQRHMQQFSNFNQGLTRVFSFLLGQEGQLLANGISIPNYFFEGDAVWQETLVSRQGRGRMPSFYNGLRALWSSQRTWNWMQLRNGSLRKYYPDHYETGYPLVLYGYEQYGPDFWKKVTGDAVRFKGLFYAFNKAVQRHSGKSYSRFTEDALQWYRSQLQAGSTSGDSLRFITPADKNNVKDYLFPHFVNDDTLLVTRQSYQDINSFYLVAGGKEIPLRVKDYVLDDYFSYRNGQLVYAAYQSDPRWYNRNYSVLKLFDIHTGEHRSLTSRSRYFSPDISMDGTEVLAVAVDEAGRSVLHRLHAESGKLLAAIPNPGNLFFTQTKYLHAQAAVSAVRNAAGEMALVTIDLRTGDTGMLLPFSNRLIGYPFIHGSLVYFSMSDDQQLPVDRVFAVDTATRQLYRISHNSNGVYHPVINSRGKVVVSAFTAEGMRLAEIPDPQAVAVSPGKGSSLPPPGMKALAMPGADVLQQVHAGDIPGKPYRKSFRMFNFHSARPFADDPEYGYTLYGDNVLSSLRSEVTYTYNRNEQSHAIGYAAVYGGWFPFLRAGAERSFSRKVDTGNVSRNEFSYNATKLYAGFSIPLNFINGRTFRFFNIGGGYNSEYVPYQLVGKEVRTRALNYFNAFVQVSNRARKPRQLINPAWAQELTVTYRDAVTLVNNRKWVGDGALFFPGLLRTHSIVLNGAYQRRDTLADFFSKTFPFSRGYQDLNQRRMYKLGVNYHLPLAFPDWGMGNIFFIQRIRLNLFYDYTSSLTKFSNGALLDIKSRSGGAELNFDGKIWNALPAGIGIRYSRLFDRDYLNPGAVNRWEIILPINIIPD